MIEAMEFASEIPVIAGIQSDWDGNLWIERGAAPGEPGPTDIVTARGDYLGTVAGGSMPRVAAFGPRGLVAFLGRDTLDVPTVVIARARLR